MNTVSAAGNLVVDTSAFVAVYNLEKGWEKIDHILQTHPALSVPASCLTEIALLKSLGYGLQVWFDEIMRSDRLTVASIDPEIAKISRSTALEMGKGSGHPAKLNFGDCLSYAVAKYRGLPLLFVGDDFTHTDIEPAISWTAT